MIIIITDAESLMWTYCLSFLFYSKTLILRLINAAVFQDVNPCCFPTLLSVMLSPDVGCFKWPKNINKKKKYIKKIIKNNGHNDEQY